MSVNGLISGVFQGSDIRTVGLNSNANIPCNQQPSTAFSNGSGALGAQVLYQAVLTFSGTAETVDLQGGTFSDSYGTAIVLTAVKALYVQNNSATNTVVVGNAGTHPWAGLLNATGTITLQPGDWVILATPSSSGWAVSSTSSQLLFTGTSGQTFNVALLGVGT